MEHAASTLNEGGQGRVWREEWPWSDLGFIRLLPTAMWKREHSEGGVKEWEQQRGKWLRLSGGTFWIFLSHSSFSPSAKGDGNSVSFTGGLNKLTVCLGQGMCSVHTSVLIIIIITNSSSEARIIMPTFWMRRLRLRGQMAGEWQSCISPELLGTFLRRHTGLKKTRNPDERQRVSKPGEVFSHHLSTEGSSGQLSDPVWLF